MSKATEETDWLLSINFIYLLKRRRAPHLRSPISVHVSASVFRMALIYKRVYKNIFCLLGRYYRKFGPLIPKIKEEVLAEEALQPVICLLSVAVCHAQKVGWRQLY